MCETPHKAVATRFAGFGREVLNKVIHRARGRVQLFSGIQNLAAKLKYYFNFDPVASCASLRAPRFHAASPCLLARAA
ncbi:hypothetical protein BTH42_22985 [Burkholderia sp. SRS-W-2-2016]|nr:hypothetical protein BTH42_22985 [Burkholderia sp. SRS-W-2-2016]